MKRIANRAVATATAVALFFFSFAVVYAGTNNADEGSGYEVDFDFDFSEPDRTETTIYTIDLTNTSKAPTATPSEATPSDAVEEPEKPIKPIDGDYSGSDHEEGTEGKIITFPVNIEGGKAGTIEAHYDRPTIEIPVIPIEPDTPDSGGEDSGGLAGLPKTGDRGITAEVILLCGSLATMIILLKKKRGKSNESIDN